MNRVFVVSVWLLAVAVGVAQEPTRGRATPISPEIKVFSDRGLLVGVPIALQQGQYVDTCYCPPFSGGSGSGITVGAFYELPAAEEQLIKFGISAGLDYRSLLSQYREQELLTFTSTDGSQQFQNVPVEFRQQMQFRFLGLWAQPYIRIVPFTSEAIAMSAGVQAGMLVVGNAQHTKSLVQNTTRLPNGEVVALQMPNGETSTVVRDGEIVGLQRFQAAAIVRLESSIELSQRLRLRPGVQFAAPLTAFSSSGNPKVATWLIMLSLAWKTQQ